jgi:hypothetical protein
MTKRNPHFGGESLCLENRPSVIARLKVHPPKTRASRAPFRPGASSFKRGPERRTGARSPRP